MADAAAGAPEALTPVWGAVTHEFQGVPPPPLPLLVLVKSKAKCAQETSVCQCPRETGI